MNDEHDNAQDDKEMFRRIRESRTQAFGIVHGDGRQTWINEEDEAQEPWRWPDAAGTTNSLRGPETGDMVQPEDEDNIQATIHSNMSDLEVANEVIRVAGYERTEHIAAILFDRTIEQA